MCFAGSLPALKRHRRQTLVQLARDQAAERRCPGRQSGCPSNEQWRSRSTSPCHILGPKLCSVRGARNAGRLHLRADARRSCTMHPGRLSPGYGCTGMDVRRSEAVHLLPVAHLEGQRNSRATSGHAHCCCCSAMDGRGVNGGALLARLDLDLSMNEWSARLLWLVLADE